MVGKIWHAMPLHCVHGMQTSGEAESKKANANDSYT
jgi:hypothetical protein